MHMRYGSLSIYAFKCIRLHDTMFGTTRSNIFKVIFGYAEYFKLLPTRGDPSSIFIYTCNIILAIITMTLNVLHLIQTVIYKSNGWVHIVFEDLSQLLPLQTFIYLQLIFVYNKRAIYELVRKTEDLGAFGNDKQLIMTDKRLAGIIKIMFIVMSGLMPTCGIAKFFLHNCEVRNPCALANFWIPLSNENAFVVFVYPLIQLLGATYITMSMYCIDFTVELSKQLLIMRLEHLNRILSKVHFNRTEKRNLKLKMCIVYHDRILSLHKEHTKCFSLMTIVPYFAYSIVTSLCLVMISINGSVTSILTIATWTAAISLQSHFAQKLLDVGATLCETAYDINWYEGSVPSQKDLLLFLLKLQVPLKTRMARMGEMSFENLGRITKCDDLPSKICIGCIEDLCKAFNFAQMCVSSDSKLKSEQVKCADYEENADDIEVHVSNGEDVDSSEIIIIKNCTNEEENIEYEHDVVNEDDENTSAEIKEKSAQQDAPKRQYVRKFRCKACPESFASFKKLTKHEKFHDPTKTHKCDICNKSFLKASQLKVHVRSHVKHEDKQFVCKICGQKFSYMYLLKKHTYKHQDVKPYPCSKCDKGCITAESLRRHMRTHDDNYVKKMHVCNICSKEFPYPSFLAEHMKNHTGEKPFLCSICGKGFRQSGTLHYHMRSHTGYRPFVCNVCQNSFKSPGVLRIHMRRHTGERPYVCDICGMAFRQSTDMKSHRRTHSGDKRVLCTICGKRLSSTGQLTIHIRSHTGEKPFSCTSCFKAFTTKTMLVKHERTHTGERPYVCRVCGKAFSQSSSLKTHTNTHCNKGGAKSFVNEGEYISGGVKRDAVLPAPVPMLQSL